jgi:hypothetical protein
MSAAFDVEAGEILPRARKRTVSVNRLAKRTLAMDAALYAKDMAQIAHEKPKTFGECRWRGLGTEKPCPYISCAHHLYLDVDEENGSITVNWPDREPTEIPETCELAVAEKHDGGMTLDAVAAVMNLTRERIRQYESRCVAKLKGELEAGGNAEDYRGPVRCAP